MKIFAISDLHARMDRIDWIKKVKETEKPDLLILAGDIINYFNPLKTVQKLTQLNLPIYYVRGNSDPARLDRCVESMENFSCLNLKTFNLNEFSLVGISGTVLLPFRSKVRLFEKRVAVDLEKLVHRNSILVVHPPPYGTRDRVGGKFNAGSKMLRTLVSKTKPGLVICGHIHEDPGETIYEETLVLNCSLGKEGKGAIIELTGSGKKPVVRFL